MNSYEWCTHTSCMDRLQRNGTGPPLYKGDIYKKKDHIANPIILSAKKFWPIGEVPL